MSRVKLLSRLGSKAIGFGLVPAVSLVTPLLVIPIVSRTVGAEGILAVTIGQSVGAVGGIVVGLGWPLVGSAMIARASEPERRRLYELSLQSRLLVFVAVIPFSIGAASILVSEERPTALLMALTFSGYGLTSIWYYIGTGKARGLLVLEVLPRIAAAVIAAFLLALGGPLIVYPLLLLAAVCASFVMNSRSVFGGLPKLDLRAAWDGISRQRRASVSRGVNSLYNGGSTSLVAAVAPSSALVFAAMDRIHRSAFSGLSTIPDAIMAWVVGVEAGRSRRVRAAIAGDLVFALLGGCIAYLVLPYVAVFLYSDLIDLAPNIRALSAGAIASLVLARAFLDHGVLAHGAERPAANLLVTSSVIGVVGVIVGSALAGAAGAITAVIVAEAVVIVGCLFFLARLEARPVSSYRDDLEVGMGGS